MKQKSILIIGGGIAGLTAGIYAQKNGFQTTIVEMHNQPGGQLTAWDREGYRFDYCLHWLMGSDHGTYHNIWRETDAINDDVQIVYHDIYTRMVDTDEGDFFIYNNLNKWESYLMEMAPEDEKGIKKLCTMMRRGDNLDSFEDAPGMRSPMDYLNSLIHVGGFLGTLMKYGKRNCGELFDSLELKNKRLLFFLHKLFGGRDFSAIGFIVMMGWFHAKNAGYLLGGSYDMATRMANKFKDLGGRLMLDTKVDKIIVKDNEAVGVCTAIGDILSGDHLIGACDGHAVLYDLLDGHFLEKKTKEAYETWPLFTPTVMVSFGIKDLVASKAHYTDYLVRDLSIGCTKVHRYSIMNRSMYDTSFAPAGKSVLLLQYESPWDLWKNLLGVAYLDEKQVIRQEAAVLLEQHYPGISQNIEVVDVATPRTTVKFTGVWKGAYEGFLPTGNITQSLPMKIKGLNRFTMAGQWLYPGGGLPPSAQSGKWAVQMICKEEGMKFRVKDPVAPGAEAQVLHVH